ncbi:23S rRNA methyltransferase [Mycobacteroides abscessus subsp. abscessus]|nr:23S rRNA methyltransferase [Mycobacteroides abscessus subsp. abscessus]
MNDQPWRADMLGKKLRKALGQMVHVNLIPLNPTPGSQWDASPKPVEREFVRRVREQGVSCTVRDTHVLDIDSVVLDNLGRGHRQPSKSQTSTTAHSVPRPLCCG